MASRIIHFTVCSLLVRVLLVKADSFVAVRTTDRSSLLMIGFALFDETNLRLPTSNDNTSLIHLIVHIRDTLDCVTEYNLPSVTVTLDTDGINALISTLQVSTNAANSNPIVQTLASGNQNAIGQVITSLSQVFNRMNVQNLDEAISSKSLLMHDFYKLLTSL